MTERPVSNTQMRSQVLYNVYVCKCLHLSHFVSLNIVQATIKCATHILYLDRKLMLIFKSFINRKFGSSESTTMSLNRG